MESSANIGGNASAQVVPFPLARRAGRDCRVSCAGHRRAHRAASLCAVDCSFFTRPEAGRIQHAGNSQIYGVDLRLVLAHSHRRQRHFLLRDLRLDCVPCTSSPPQIIRLFGGWLMLAGIGVLKRKELEANKIAKQGTQLSQESPHPSTTSQWEQTTSRHKVSWMRSIVPIGFGLRK